MDRKYRFNDTIKRLTAALLIAGLAFVISTPFSSTIAVETQSEFLTANKAFVFNGHLVNSQQFELTFTIAPGYLLYRDHFHFRTLEGQPITLPIDAFPPALNKRDDVLNEEYKVYTKSFQLLIPIASAKSAQGLRVMYQGCAENGFCYAPVAKEIIVKPNGEIQITELSVQNFNKQPDDKNNRQEKNKNATYDNYRY